MTLKPLAPSSKNKVIKVNTLPPAVQEMIDALKYLTPEEIQQFKEWLNKNY